MYELIATKSLVHKLYLKSYQLAIDNYQNNFDDLINNVKLFDKLELYRKIHETRKYLRIYKSMYKLFAQSHEPEEGLHRTCYLLGKFKDSLSNEVGSNSIILNIETLYTYSKANLTFQNEILYDSPEQIHLYLRAQLSQIPQLIKANGYEDIHNIRKILLYPMNIYYLSHLLYDENHLKQKYTQIREIRIEIENEMIKESKQPVKRYIEEALSKRILQLINTLEQ